TAYLGKHHIDFVAHDLQYACHAGLAASGDAIKRGSAENAGLGTQATCNNEIRAATYTAVQHELHALAYRSVNGRQHIQRRRSGIQLTSAMVGYDQAIDPQFHS